VDSTGKKAQLTGKKAQLTGKKAQLTGYNHRPRAVAAPYKQERTRKNAKAGPQRLGKWRFDPRAAPLQSLHAHPTTRATQGSARAFRSFAALPPACALRLRVTSQGLVVQCRYGAVLPVP